MMHFRVINGFLATVLLVILPQLALAQEAPKTIDESTLKVLYEQQSKAPDDSYIQKRIDDERASIREFVEEELQKGIAPPDEETELDASEFQKALDRQKGVISGLQERLRERRVDLDLLITEEEKFYLSPETATGAIEGEKFRLTKTYEGLLTKKAILEERIHVLESLIVQQQNRLDKLAQEDRLLQFAVYILVAKYIGILFLIWLIERIVRTTVFARIRSDDRRYTITKLFTTTIYTLAVLWLGVVLFAEKPGIFASFAIIGAGIAIALQDLIKDFFGWIMIYQQRLYSIGDRVSLGDYTGEVIDIDLFRTKLLEVGLPPDGVLEHTGKILSIPNSYALANSIANHSTTSDFVNAEMRITITFESDWEKAKHIIEKILSKETAEYTEKAKGQQRRRARMLYIQRQVIGPLVYTDIAADGVEFTLRFSVPIGERRSVVMRLAERILSEFNKEKAVALAYKTVRYYTTGESRKH